LGNGGEKQGLFAAGAEKGGGLPHRPVFSANFLHTLLIPSLSKDASERKIQALKVLFSLFFGRRRLLSNTSFVLRQAQDEEARDEERVERSGTDFSALAPRGCVGAREGEIMRRSYWTLPAGLLASLVLAAPAGAAEGGFYAGARGGVSFTHDGDMDAPDIPTVTIEYGTGYGVSGFAGYRFASPWRVEGEIAYRASPLESVSAPVAGSLEAGGEITALSFMVNGMRELETGGAFTPYFGGGLGVVYLSMNNANLAVPAEYVDLLGESPLVFADDSITVPAVQFIGGVAWQVGEKLALTVDYRLLIAIGPEFTGAIGNVEAEYHNSTIMAGLRVDF
jgi:opacity protein-like surface antigen